MVLFNRQELDHPQLAGSISVKSSWKKPHATLNCTPNLLGADAAHRAVV